MSAIELATAGKKNWSVQSVVTSASTAAAIDVSTASIIGVHLSAEIYFNFSITTTDVNASNDLVLDKDTLIFLTVPLSLGPDSIYFNHNSTSTTTGAVRIVEI